MRQAAEEEDGRLPGSGLWAPWAVGVLLLLAVWLLVPHAPVDSDAWVYSRYAHLMATGRFTDVLAHHPFPHRLGLIVPTSLVYGSLGVGLATTHAWSLLVGLGTVGVVVAALPASRWRLVGAVIAAVSLPVVRASTSLYPDLSAGLFMAASVLFLRRARRSQDGGAGWIVAGVFALFWAFLTKLTAYWALLFWVAVAVHDLIGPGDRAGRRRMWGRAAGAAALLFLGYLVLCASLWGDPLARLRAVSGLTSDHLWATEWARDPVRRFVHGPPLLFWQVVGPASVLVLVGLLDGRRRMRWWTIYFGTVLLAYWLGPTSLGDYEPLPLSARMLWPVVPPALILATEGLRRLAVRWRGSRRRPLVQWAVALGLAGLLILPLARYVRGAVLDVREPEVVAELVERVSARPGDGWLLFTADCRSADLLAFYFGYRYPSGLIVRTPGETLGGPMPPADRVLLYRNAGRAAFLHDVYGAPDRSDELLAAAGARLAGDDGIGLWRARSEDAARSLARAPRAACSDRARGVLPGADVAAARLLPDSGTTP